MKNTKTFQIIERFFGMIAIDVAELELKLTIKNVEPEKEDGPKQEVTVLLWHHLLKDRKDLQVFKRIFGPFKEPSEEDSRWGSPTIKGETEFDGITFKLEYEGAYSCESLGHRCTLREIG